MGVYTITYMVVDGSGNTAVSVTRTVTIVDTVAPVVTLLGDSIIATECGTAYVD